MTSTAWSEGPFLAFDTETTGVDVTSDRLVTVGLVRREGGAQDVRTWLVDPGIPIPPGATAIHGVTTEQARAEGSPTAEVAEEVAELLADALGAGVPVVIFNAGYDLALLENELRRHKLPTLRERLGAPIAPIIDPLAIDRGVNRFRKGKRTLDALCAAYGVTTDAELHRAENDAEVTLDLAQAMLAFSPTLRGLTLAQLHAEQGGWHRAWATSFNEWLERKGRRGDVEVTWPL